MGVTDGDTEGAVIELVNVVHGVAQTGVVAIRVQLAEVGHFIEGVHRDGALPVLEGTCCPHVDGAGKALADKVGLGGLVDHDPVEQLGRVLVELDATAGVGADLLASVEEARAEITDEAADDNTLGAAVDPLGGQAGQAGQCFRDTGVRQLADVLGGDCLDDQRGAFLDFGGCLDTLGKAGRFHLECLEIEDQAVFFSRRPGVLRGQSDAR